MRGIPSSWVRASGLRGLSLPAHAFSALIPHASVLITRLEPWVVVPCALVLLLYPNPLIVPAAIIGLLPSAVRWLATGRPWPRSAFDVPLALFVGGALLGATAGLSRDGTGLRLCGLLAGLMLYAAMLEHATTPDRLRALVVGGLASAVLTTIALLVLVHPFLRLDRLGPLGPLVTSLDPWGAALRIANDEVILQRYRFRASGVGALADIGLALVFGAMIGIRSWTRRAALLVPGLLFATALLVSDNRGSIVAGALTIGTLVTFWRPRLLPLIPGGGLAALVLLATGLVERGLNLRTISQRFWFWENSLYLAQELPLTGAGLGTQSVQLTYKAYFQPFYPPFSHAHNIYLQSLLEQGMFGLLGLSGLALATLWVGWQACRGGDNWSRGAGFAGLGIGLALFTTGLTEIAALSTVGGMLMLVGLGMVSAAANRGPRTEDRVLSTSALRGTEDRGLRVSPQSSVLSPQSWSKRGRLAAVAVVLAVLLALQLITGLVTRTASAVVLNFGTVELNRATLSEDTSRAERGSYLDQAVWLLRAAADLDDSNPAAPRNLALALAAQDDGRRARLAADRARAATSPADPRGQFQLGRAYIAAGAWADAIKAWQTAVAGPQLLQLGGRLFRLHNWDQAIAAYTAAAIIEPDSNSSYEGIARAARERSDAPDQVAAQFAPLIARGGWNEFNARVQIARVNREAGRPLYALDSIRLAGVDRTSPEFDMEQGLALAQLGHSDRAEPFLEYATLALPDETDSFYWLGFVQLRLGKAEAAIATEQAGLAKLEPTKLAQRGPFMAVIGEGLMALRRPAEALVAYQEGAAATPGNRHLLDGAARAEAALSGAPINLLANPGFEWDGEWQVVPESDPSSVSTWSSEHPAIGERCAEVAAGLRGGRFITQEVRTLQAGLTYRLTARARTAGLARGIATARIAEHGRLPIVHAHAETNSVEWSTLELTFRAPDRPIYVDLGFPDDADSGAMAWFDEVTLVPLEGGR